MTITGSELESEEIKFIMSPSTVITEDNIVILTYSSSCVAIFGGGPSLIRGVHLSMAFLLLELVKKMSINPVE